MYVRTSEDRGHKAHLLNSRYSRHSGYRCVNQCAARVSTGCPKKTKPRMNVVALAKIATLMYWASKSGIKGATSLSRGV